jgi:16S rRNA (guanine966-N2)-methyltransferase
MRVIAGEFRSRALVAPRGLSTRPTSDRLRETLFNVLSGRVQGARFADLFAGSGAVGIEALSRGATHCFFVEQAPPALDALRKNVAALKLMDRATIESRTVGRALAAASKQPPRFDVVFLDPPYEAAAEYASTMDLLAEQREALLAPGALVVAEHAKRDSLRERYGMLERTRVLLQGDAALSFFSVQRTES